MTTSEKDLIGKSYYQTFMEDSREEHPIKILSDMFMDERLNETADLSNVRFAQGEVYFLHKDFETAIFKWENVSNELKPWALKNIGDAHYELDLLAIAEDYYKAVETESDILKTEILLQLFSLYIRLGQVDLATESIKDAVDLNPDYPDVATLARVFFEDNQDWDNAVELALNEAIRTESLSWFVVLEEYVERGHTAKIEPNYFSAALMALYHIDQARFESLSTALWYSYKRSDMYFPWLKEFNDLLLNIEQENPYTWKELTALYKETYFELINGEYLIKDFSYLIPSHLINWLKISSASEAMISSSAVLSWNEIFPSNIDSSLVSQAENILSQSTSHNRVNMVDGFKLFESIMNWANQEGLKLGERFEWAAHELLDLNHYHLLIVDSASRGKSNLVNLFVEDKLLENPYKDAEEIEQQAFIDDEVRNISSIGEFRQSKRREQTLIPCKIPVSSSNENELALMDSPISVVQRSFGADALQYLHSADGVLFVLNVDSYMTGKELEMAFRITEKLPELPIHFLLWTMDRMTGSQGARMQVEKTVSRIDEYFPNAKVSAISAYDSESQLNELTTFARLIMEGSNLEEERTEKVLHFIKMSLKLLLEKRVEKENAIIEKINWNEEMVVKLGGTQNQLGDMEEQKTRVIKRSFSQIKDELRQNLMVKIPDLLQDCSNMVNEDSDFGKIHLMLNEEMNNRIASFIEKTALPNFREAIQEWIQDCEREFKDGQTYLDEISDSFNQLYGEKRMTLNCDFKVLDDWRRDVDRMTRGNIELERVNILLRFTPSQLLLKSAGKLFGALSKNKEMLHNKYKQFIVNKDYSQTAETISDRFMLQFDLFEKSLERDTNMFFATPFEILKKTIEETQLDIEEKKLVLGNMQENPESYRDPLTLFELQVRQYDWMNCNVGERNLEYR